MESSKDILLNNGQHMPLVGLGTFGLKDKDSVVNAVVNLGYRHIDTASFYANEEIIGEALKEIFSTTSIKREDIFIVTKLWHTQYEDVEAALKLSLQKLGVEYVDVYLIHWPIHFFTEKPMPLYKLWASLEALVD